MKEPVFKKIEKIPDIGDTIVIKNPQWHDHAEWYEKTMCLSVGSGFIKVSSSVPINGIVPVFSVYKYTSDEEINKANATLREMYPNFQTNMRAQEKLKSITEKQAVHCPTKEQAIKFCKLLHEAGHKWKDGQFYFDNTSWEWYKGNTCYDLDGGFASVDQYKKDGYKIINVDQFIEPKYKMIPPQDCTETSEIEKMINALKSNTFNSDIDSKNLAWVLHEAELLIDINVLQPLKTPSIRDIDTYTKVVTILSELRRFSKMFNPVNDKPATEILKREIKNSASGFVIIIVHTKFLAKLINEGFDHRKCNYRILTSSDIEEEEILIY